MELLLEHVVVSLKLTNIHILIITTWSKKEKEVKFFALQTQARFSIHSQWLQKTVMVREKMVLIECYFWSTHPVCPRSAAWWSAPLPLLSFWFILAPFCKRNSQAGNDPLRKKNNNFITWWPFHEGIASTQHSKTPSTERVKPTPKTDWWSAVFHSSSSFTQFTLAPENFP